MGGSRVAPMGSTRKQLSGDVCRVSGVHCCWLITNRPHMPSEGCVASESCRDASYVAVVEDLPKEGCLRN